MPPKKKHPTSQEKEKLNNEEIADVNLKRAEKLCKAGKIQEADEAYNRFKKGIGRLKD